MIRNDILCLGLTRLQLQTLCCQFPFGFNFHNVSATGLTDDAENIETLVSKSWVAFINPKKLLPGQLSDIVEAHKYATEHTHATILLFTDAFTQEQRATVDTKCLFRVNLRSGMDRNLRKTIDLVRKATMPCWDGMSRMRSNMLNDGWYLVQMETTGLDPTEDDIISLTVSFMADYELLSIETLYIKQNRPLTERIIEITGITDDMLENAITKEEAVKYLQNLPSPSPIIFESAQYFLPFMKELFHLCGEKFDLPNVAIDGLAAITLGHTLARTPREVAVAVAKWRRDNPSADNFFIERLYETTLAVFDNLQNRYGVRSAGDFHTLYYGEIECGE